MSHVTGTVQPVVPISKIGPDFGPSTNPPDTWGLDFAYTPAPTGTKFVMLHFTGASFPANNRLEVDLGYGGGEIDVFTAEDGTDFWTRPINVYALAGGTVSIRYITDGAASGGVQLDQYGRGERHTKDPANSSPQLDSYTNCDPFLDPSRTSYLEPDYATFWFCNDPPNWENAACVNQAADVRNIVAPSVGMILHVDYSDALGFHLSTCTVTLVSPDTVITAGHCMQDPIDDAKSSSVIFGYQTQCNGHRPAGYAPMVHKVKEVIAQHFADGTPRDYCLLRLKTPVAGITPTPMRNDIPAVGEQVFGLHHPNGAVKKLSIPHPAFASIYASNVNSIQVSLDVSGGSSGSGLFDMSGRIAGVLSNGYACHLSYYPTATAQQDLAAPPAITRDVMLVFDRSGSMSLPGTSGQAKIEEARAAASLFVQLVRTGTGNRVGLESFSTTASLPVDFALADVTAASKTALIGPPPYMTGVIGGLAAGGSTTIGGGLNAAYAQLPAGTNPRNILLLTDGMQNTPPMANPSDSSPAGIVIDVIGYGTPASLDGEFLKALATNHLGPNHGHGQYVLADTNLKLQKFFSLAFGNIFEAGLVTDPELELPAGQSTAAPVPFNVCEEESITVVVGWDHRDTPLLIELLTPSGTTVTASSPGVESSSSLTWTFLRVPLPHAGERDGVWQVRVHRAGTAGGEFEVRTPQVRFFVNVVAGGGAVLRRMPDTRIYYTGDTINPLVGLQYLKGGTPPNIKARVLVSRPDAGVGNLLVKEKLGGAAVIDADSIPPRQATLMEIEQRTGKPILGYTQHGFELYDDVMSTGCPESGGTFGRSLQNLLVIEGNYTFHAQASYGEGCTATRELLWTVHVRTGIDPLHTSLTSTLTRGKGVLVIIPRDRFDNHLGPGMGDAIRVTGILGTTVIGVPHDNGDGSYTVDVDWDSGMGNSPGVQISQPGRSPVTVTDPNVAGKDRCRIWKIAFWVLLLVALILLLLWLT